MPVYSSLFDNLLFFGRNVVYTAVCVNTHVLNLAFSLLGMYFPLFLLNHVSPWAFIYLFIYALPKAMNGWAMPMVRC